MSKKPINLKSFIINTLRRASYRWPARGEALSKARITRGVYRCASCQGEFKNKEISLDHINPVVPLTGFISWDSYVERMFCDASGFQVVCHPCHDAKTMIERELRKGKRVKKAKKKVK